MTSTPVQSAAPLRRTRKLVKLLCRSPYRAALRYGVPAGIEHERVPFVADFGTVIDVGANRGQFALVAAARFPQARLVCFEPLPGPRQRLSRVLGHRTGTEISPIAAGATSGQADFHVSRSADSSSLLNITPQMTAVFPGTDESRVVQVSVGRLDAQSWLAIARPSLLKIDVQGAELDVLTGASGILDQIDEVYVECSFVELYEGQALAEDVVAFLRDHAFSLRGIFNVTRAADGSCIQADFLFGRRVAT